MNNRRRWIGLLLSICFIVTLLSAVSVPASAANASSKNKDVDQNAWYVPYIDYVVEHGLMAGNSATAFAPMAVSHVRNMCRSCMHWQRNPR